MKLNVNKIKKTYKPIYLIFWASYKQKGPPIKKTYAFESYRKRYTFYHESIMLMKQLINYQLSISILNRVFFSHGKILILI